MACALKQVNHEGNKFLAVISSKSNTDVVNDKNELISGFKSKRSNKYYRAPINYYSYPDGVEWSSRGNESNRDKPNKKDCGTYRYSLTPLDNKGKPKHAWCRCGKITCHICGFSASVAAGKRIGLKLLYLKDAGGWKSLTFGTLNIYNPSTHVYGATKREKSNIDFILHPKMDFEMWAKKAFKNASRVLKEIGFLGFYLIIHADRIYKNTDFRDWSPHIHFIGLGKMPAQIPFMDKYNFNYTTFKSIHFHNQKEKEGLTSRIAYYINHAATYSINVVRKNGKTEKRNAPIARAFGICANNMSKVIKSDDPELIVCNDLGSPYVAKNLKPWLKSSKPKHARLKLIKKGKSIAKSIKKNDYPGIKGTKTNRLSAWIFNNYDKKDAHDKLSEQIYNKNLKLDPNWVKENPELVLNKYSKYDDKKIYLKYVEHIRVVKVRKLSYRKKKKGIKPIPQYYPAHRISSYELIEGLEPSYKAEQKQKYIEVKIERENYTNIIEVD